MQYDFNLLPNGGQTIEVVGRFVTYKEGLGKIRVKMSKGGFVDLVPGQGVEDVEFTQITINDLSGAANKGSVLAGAFKFRDATIAGSVNVIDGGKSRTLASMAFLGAFSVNGVASLNSASEIWNPAGSNKNLIIESIFVGSSIAGNIAIGWTPTNIGGAMGNSVSKKAGGSLSTSNNTGNTINGTPAGFQYLSFLPITVNGTLTLKFSEPVVIPPGFGLCLMHVTQNANIIGSIEFFEESM